MEFILGEVGVTSRVHSHASNIEIKTDILVTSPPENVLRARTRDVSISCRRQRLYANVVLPGGNVYLCSMDYALEECLGNLVQESYAQVTLGSKFRSVVDRMVGRTGEIICRKCEYAVAGSYVVD